MTKIEHVVPPIRYLPRQDKTTYQNRLSRYLVNPLPFGFRDLTFSFMVKTND
jgi:hypothetical protein